MSKKLTTNFSNYMVAAVLAGSLLLTGCMDYVTLGLLAALPEDSEQPAKPKVANKADTPKASTERHPTPEEIVKDPERFGKDVYWGNTCEVLKVQFNMETMQAENLQRNLTIERVYQRVVRKNCANEVVSDEVETVSSPTREFDLKIPGVKRARSFFIYNDQTCAHKLATLDGADSILWGPTYPVTSDGKSILSVKGDMADALLTFHMREGMNNIFVKYFYDCSPHNVIGNDHRTIGKSNCQESKESLIVQYPVFVTYNKRTIEGVWNIQPTPQECEKQSKKP